MKVFSARRNDRNYWSKIDLESDWNRTGVAMVTGVNGSRADRSGTGKNIKFASFSTEINGKGISLTLSTATANTVTFIIKIHREIQNQI